MKGWEMRNGVIMHDGIPALYIERPETADGQRKPFTPVQLMAVQTQLFEAIKVGLIEVPARTFADADRIERGAPAKMQALAAAEVAQ